MSLTGLPEQVRSRVLTEDDDVAHSLKANADWTQSCMSSHTVLSDTLFFPKEIAEPQPRCLQKTAACLRVQPILCTALHSPIFFTSTVPAQRLAPPTTLTEVNVLLQIISWKNFTAHSLLWFIFSLICLFTCWTVCPYRLDICGEKQWIHQY